MSKNASRKIDHEAWARNAISFIRERGLELEFTDWCGGWPCPVKEDGSPPMPTDDKKTIEQVRAEIEQMKRQIEAIEKVVKAIEERREKK